MGPQVSDGKYALSVKLGVLAVGGILVVYERSTTETQSARRTHREKNENYGLGSHACSFFVLELYIVIINRFLNGHFQVLKL
jgi:hypothetical protein